MMLSGFFAGHGTARYERCEGPVVSSNGAGRAERIVQAKMDRIDALDEVELRGLLRTLNRHIGALEAEKQYLLGRLVELTPSYEED